MNLAVPVTAAQAARLAGVSPQTLAMWKTRGKIHPITRVGRSPIYLLADVLEVERATRRASDGRPRTHAPQQAAA